MSGFAARRATRLALSTIAAIVLSGVAHAQDATGSRDHPLIQRYAGSRIIGYDARKFDELVIPAGAPTASGGRIVYSETRTLEGKHTRIIYAAPPDRSPLEVFRNYELALRDAGFEPLYACANEACGKPDSLKNLLYPSGRKLKNAGQVTEYAFNFPAEPRYLSAKRSRPEGEVYVSVYVARETFDHFKDTSNRALTMLDVVEVAALERNMVTVKASEMARDIAAAGRVALYGILFDFNSATLKPESDPTLVEIAKLLSADARLKLYVVGHTDNVGGYDFNVDLSQRRATAVVQALASRHSVSAARLRPVGIGLVAPVAPNESEDGRAKNRRVELVRQ